MKKYLSFIFCLLLLSKAWATTVTATITDTDGQTWNNGAWSVILVNPRPDITPNVNGTNLTANQISQSGTMNGSGVLSVTLVDSSTISPVGTAWRFSICPNASSSCGTGALAVTGSTANLSTALSSFITAPRFAPGPNAYGYLNGEVITSLYPGAIYYNVTSNTQQIYNKITATWSANSGSSGAPTTCANTNNYPCLNTANVFSMVQTAPNYASGTSGTLIMGQDLAAAGYNIISFNGIVNSGTGSLGCTGDSSGGDPNFYCNTPTGGHHVNLVNGTIIDDSSSVVRLQDIPIRLPIYTVSTLPAASSLTAGSQVIVTDATTFTPGTCTGSGSDYMIAITNGTTWSCH